MLTHAAMHIRAAPVVCGEGRQATLVAGGGFQVCAAHHAFGQQRGQQVVDLGRDEDAARRRRGLQGLVLVVQQDLLPIGGQLTPHHAFKLAAFGSGQGGHPRLPCSVRALAALASVTPGLLHTGRHFKRAMRPAQQLACGLRVFGKQATAVAAALALQAGNAFGNHRAARQHRRARVSACGVERGRHRLDVVPIHLDHMPARHAKALGHVFADRQIGAAVVGDQVVVPQQHQLAQVEVACQRNHLLPHALLQAAVAHKGVGVVINQILAKAGVQIRLCHRHAEGIGNALAQRAGGDLDADGRVALGVAFAVRAQLAKALDFFNRKVRVARQVQQRIQQHRAVPVGQHHAVAVKPLGLSWVELEVARVQRGGNFGHAQGHALVTLLRFDDGVDGQKTDGVGQGLLGVGAHVMDKHPGADARLSPVYSNDGKDFCQLGT
jgi:hypothetical protein